LIQVGNVAACKANEQTAQGSALGFNPAKKVRPVGAKAFIFLTMLLPLQGVHWRLTCTQGAALGCLLAGLTGRSLAGTSSGMYCSRLQREETIVRFDVPLNAKDASTHSKQHRAF